MLRQSQTDSILSGTVRVWVFFVLALAACLPPILVKLGRTEPDRIMENVTLMSSQETWIRQRSGEHGAWLMPSWNGRPRIEKPPMSIWLNMLAWTDLDPATVPADTVLLRARRVAAATALLALIATFWAGMSLTRDPRAAAVAVLVTGTTAAFIRQARFATYDTHLLGFATLAIAAGLWALTGDAGPRRRWIGWSVCALATAAAVLSKGPLGFPLVLGPLAVMIAVMPGRRRTGFAGLVAAMAAATVLAAPWFMYMTHHVGHVKERLAFEYLVPSYTVKPPWYYLKLIPIAFPWSLWLIVAVALPFVKGLRERRRDLLPAWLWFVVIFVMFSITKAKTQRYISPILPALGLVVAQVWSSYESLARDGKWVGALRWLYRIQWVVLLVLSTAFPLAVVLQHPLLKIGILKQLELPGLGSVAGIGLWMLLTGLSMAGFWWHSTGRTWFAAVVTGLWMTVFATAGYHGYAQSRHSKYAHRPDAERVAAAATGHKLVYLQIDEKVDDEPTKVFLFYVRRIIPAIGRNDLPALARATPPVDIIISAGRGREEIVEQAAFVRKFDFADDDGLSRRLYESVPVAP